jgi:hypothetical protein
VPTTVEPFVETSNELAGRIPQGCARRSQAVCGLRYFIGARILVGIQGMSRCGAAKRFVWIRRETSLPIDTRDERVGARTIALQDYGALDY